jgi:hypothetical protein
LAKISFSEEQIPELKGKMPVLRLESPVLAPETTLEEFALNATLQESAPNMGGPNATGEVEFRTLGNILRAGFDGDRLVAYLNPTSGESRVFPLIEGLKPGIDIAARANAVALRFAANEAFFPKDATTLDPLPASTLMGARHVKGQGRGAARELLAFVRLQRRVNGYPVWGPGTRAMIAVDAAGQIRGLSHRWRKAVVSGETVTPYSRAQLMRPILAQIERSVPNADVTVRKVTLGYFDNGGGVMQPVLRFGATIHAPRARNGKRRPTDSHLFGYVWIGAGLEPLPELGVLTGAPPSYAPQRRAQAPAQPAVAGDPTVGRYVVRNDSADWVNSANGFLNGLQLANFFGSPIPFTDSQYYWAEPFEYVSDKDGFINSVHIALTESHGNWGVFSTRDNQDDLVFLSDIPSTGYGGPGNSLAYWTIHSCEVIPTQTDEAASFDVWWNIFQGLHAVTGYRTEMWINDNATGPFGFAIGLGAPVVSSWLNAVASDDAYDDGDTYFDGNRNMTEPMGRASAIAVCGHGDDTVTNLGSLGPANCLTEWWFNN